MSRYTFTGNRPNFHVLVGYDRPLQTFFAQVWDTSEPENPELLLWAGAGPEPVRYVEALAELLAPFGEIPEEVAAKLWADFGEQCEKLAPFKLLFGK